MQWATAAAAVEGGVLLAAVFVAPPDLEEKVTHFTWWGIASLILFDVSLVLRSYVPQLYASVYFVAATIAVTVAIGVVGLSAVRCTLLGEALREFGPGGYVLGNTAIHYYPVTRVLANEAPEQTPEGRAHQYLFVTTLLLVYIQINDASAVYGCDVSQYVVVGAAVAGVAIASAAEGSVYRWYDWILRGKAPPRRRRSPNLLRRAWARLTADQKRAIIAPAAAR